MSNTLRFVERHADYSIYTNAEGDEVFVGHGWPRRILVEFDKDEMVEAWNDWKFDYGSGRDGRRAFLEHLRNTLTEPEMADEVRWCSDCSDVEMEDDGHGVENGEFVCDSCYENYSWCDNCEESCRHTVGALDDRSICDGCRERYYSYCEDCEGWYRDSDAHEHEHEDDEGDGCCESPRTSFTIRNDGNEPLANDTRVTVTLPGGTIDDEGLQRIYRHLRRNTVSVTARYAEENGDFECYFLQGYHTQAPVDKTTFTDYDVAIEAATSHNDKVAQVSRLVQQTDANFIGNKVQTKDGNYTKRLSRAAHKVYAAKIEPAVLSEIGNIASAHSQSVDFAVETTRELNMGAREFAHSDSCWWQSYYKGRCSLKTNGGFGLRSFDNYGDVSGRAWVMPMRAVDGKAFPMVGSLTPTFDTDTPDAFIVFNGYKNLGGYNPARIIAHMAGWTYRKISFTCEPMFINGDMGYLVAPEEIAMHYTDGRIDLRTDQHSNLFCIESLNTESLNTEKEMANV